MFDIKGLFWAFIGFLRFGWMTHRRCGHKLKYLWHPGVVVYPDVPQTIAKEWAYYCNFCPTVVYSDTGFADEVKE